MKRFFKKSKKPSKPSQQPNAAGNPAAVAAGPPGLRAEQDLFPDGGQPEILSYRDLNADCLDVTVLPDEGGEIVPHTPFQSRAEGVDQEPPVSGAQTPSVAIDGASGGNHPTSERSLGSCIGIDVDVRFSPSQLRTLATLGETLSSLHKYPSVRADVMIVLVSIYRVLDTKKARGKTSPGGARDGTKKLGLLKAALGAILNFYADREVRSHPLARNSPPTNTSPGIHRCGEQDRKPPLAYKCTGRTI